MKIKEPTQARMSVRFRVRARHYRLAAAVADIAGEQEMFRNLATTFERLSQHFARAEMRSRSV